MRLPCTISYLFALTRPDEQRRARNTQPHTHTYLDRRRIHILSDFYVWFVISLYYIVGKYMKRR